MNWLLAGIGDMFIIVPHNLRMAIQLIEEENYRLFEAQSKGIDVDINNTLRTEEIYRLRKLDSEARELTKKLKEQSDQLKR